MNERMSLTEFLLARIAEDEEIARDAIGHPLHISTDWEGMATQRHIYRWSSARVLAECEAKRAIVEADARRWRVREDAVLAPAYGSDPSGRICVRHADSDELITLDEFNERYCERAAPSDHLRLLALPYADHPDYDESWRP